MEPPTSLMKPLIIPNKILMGPGPSNVPQRVLNVLSNPIIGHLHPETLKIMDEIKEGLQYILQTKNPATMCVSASGHGGMEATLCNLIERGDVILIGITGLWGQRAADMAERYGGDVRILQAKLGKTLSYEEIKESIKVHKPSIFFITHGDSSTGILQTNLAEIGALCRSKNCIFLVDAVASLGGATFLMDEWKIDAVYAGTQKVLSAPPGLAPISFNSRAMKKVFERVTKPCVFYWDIKLLGDCWNCFGNKRLYHHTISPTLLYGLREALSIFCEQGLEAVNKRHLECSLRLQKGLEAYGFELFVNDVKNRLPTVTTIKLPPNINWTSISEYAMKNYSLELAGGLGPTIGLVFRIGVMGENATPERVDFTLKVLFESFEKTSSFTDTGPKSYNISNFCIINNSLEQSDITR